ncbi:MAG: DUF1592 domain-containing protein [Sandaracinaceae bacterium]
MRRATVVAFVLLATACSGLIDEPDHPSELAGAPGLRALSQTAYVSSVRAVLGDDVPVEPLGRWETSIAAARGGVSPELTEQYEASAMSTTAYVFDDPSRALALTGCVPSGEEDDACAREAIGRLGRRAFRRRLTDEELTRYLTLAHDVGEGDGWRGLRFATAGLLESPHFLYRVEIGDEGKATSLGDRFSDDEIAARLAFLLWNAPPDDALLDRVEQGALSTDEGVAAVVDSMLEDPRADAGRRRFFADLFQLDALRRVQKREEQFPEFDEALVLDMREQLVRTAVAAANDGGMRSVFTTRSTFLNRRLAEHFGIAGEFGEDMTRFELPPTDARAGVLTLPAFLTLQSYPASTGPALRGLFVRRDLLCQDIPPPPPGVSTVLPESSDMPMTARQALSGHQRSANCVACHSLMDPIGLALEHFDAVGHYRRFDHDLPIDPSGDLDGVPFEDAAGLGAAVGAHPRLMRCLTEAMYASGAGQRVAPESARALQRLLGKLDRDAFTLDDLFRAVATSDLFLYLEPS